MTSQPGGGPAIPVAAAVAGLGGDEDRTDEGTGNENDDQLFAGAGGQADQTDDGVPVGSADAEQDRIRASDDEGDDDDS